MSTLKWQQTVLMCHEWRGCFGCRLLYSDSVINESIVYDEGWMKGWNEWEPRNVCEVRGSRFASSALLEIIEVHS